MEPVPIYIRRTRHWFWVLMSTFTGIMLCTVADNRNTTGGRLIIVLLACIFIYHVRELIWHKPRIVISASGIELRGHRFCTWKEIGSIKTIFEDRGESTDHEYLVFFFYESESYTMNIETLDKTREEIVALILAYNDNRIFYEGHEVK